MTDHVLLIVIIITAVFFAMGIFIAKSYERIEELELNVRDLYMANGELKRGLLGLWKEIEPKQGKRKKRKHKNDGGKQEEAS